MTVTIISVTHNTLHLIKQMYESLRSVYSSIPLVIIDNGSIDGTDEYLKSLVDEHLVRVHLFRNIGHGPALDMAIHKTYSEKFFTLDSDCVVKKVGFIEDMLSKMTDGVYAVGWLRYVDPHSGVSLDWFTTKTDTSVFVPYVHPAVGMYDRSMYNSLPPFEHHGAPALANMRAAKECGYKVVDYNVSDYIVHLVAGTRRLYTGHGFGDWDPVSHPNVKPDVWDPKASLPI